MTPGATEPVDLGPNQGLRQPAVPDSAPSRFELPAPEGTAGSADAPAWRLEPAPRDPTGAQEIPGPPRPPEAATTRSQLERTRDSARAKPASSERRFDLRRLDELAMSWGNIAMVAVGLILLTIPALVLLQHLREQWLGRPRPKGERRRQLVRG